MEGHYEYTHSADKVESAVVLLETTVPPTETIEQFFEKLRQEDPELFGQWTLDDVNIEVDTQEREVQIVPRVVPRKEYLSLQARIVVQEQEIARLRAKLLDMKWRELFQSGSQMRIDPPSDLNNYPDISEN